MTAASPSCPNIADGIEAFDTVLGDALSADHIGLQARAT